MQNIDEIISALRTEQRRRTYRKNEIDWDILSRPEQKMPEGNWFGWFIMAGRGFGKTRTGAETVKKLVLSGQYKRICLLGETYDQVRSIMIEGESGLLNIHTREQMPKFKPGRRELVWPNGAIATCYSSENYQALRGPQFDLAWVDELAKFENDQAVWDQLMFCLRLGTQPRVIITTTPRPKKLIFDLANRKDIHLTRGTTFDNAQNLPKQYLDIVTTQYANTPLGRQEIEGELVSLEAGALWALEDLQYTNITHIESWLDKGKKNPLSNDDHATEYFTNHHVVIAIDPAVTAHEESDETGIIVASKHKEKYYVLEDASGIMKPEIWAQKATELYKKYNAKEVVVEINQGGDVLMAMLKSCASDVAWKAVRAKENKYKRALPIASLYKKKMVWHYQRFQALEEQLLKAHLNYKDDRLDALVWALYSLMQSQEKPNDKAIFSCWTI